MIIFNGKAIEVSADKLKTSLLSFIREILGLTGTKYGCGIGLCGACTVHVDDEAVRSCQVDMADLEGRKVTTIEGLAGRSQHLHPVQKAWIEEAVPQCGYCQPGQIMTAAAFLANNSDPTDTEIRDAMNINICRCGTYQRIRQAVRRAARETQNVK